MKSFLLFFVPACVIQAIVYHTRPETQLGEWVFLLGCFIVFSLIGMFEGKEW